MMDWILSQLAALPGYLMSPAFIFSPLYLPSTLLVAYLFWRTRKREGDFLSFAVPKAVYRHPSSWMDVKLTVFNLFFIASSVMTVLYLVPTFAYGVQGGLQEMTGYVGGGDFTWRKGALAALVLILTEDFTRYVTHYMHHKNPVLWPFHAVHHSAEVMTPVTFMRSHPLYYMIQRLLVSVLVGSLQGLLLFLLFGHVPFWVLYASVFLFQVYMFFGAHLRHSHIPVRYGWALEHVLISPAVHQVHHSTDPRHFDKNFGEIFALWDWMFGTLHIPDGTEELTFGLGDGKGGRLVQPYPTLRAALLKPFGESFQAMLQAVRPAALPHAVNDER